MMETQNLPEYEEPELNFFLPILKSLDDAT
jgi:hypothetical protein